MQIDYDPAQISYQALLDIFWESHNPARKSWSQQYKAAVFVHNAEQRALAEASKTQISAEKTGRFFNRTIHTEILPAETFYLAEDYHHKYLLQSSPEYFGEITSVYAKMEGWINSTAAARLNGYVGGYGTLAQLETEIDLLGLSERRRDQLRRLVSRFDKSRHS